MICPNCKKNIRRVAKYCDQCGFELPAISASGSHSAGNVGFIENILSSISMNTVKIVALLTAAVMLVIILVSSFSGGGNDNTFSYLKNNELYYSSVSKAKGKQASTNLLSGSDTIGDFSNHIRVDSEGKRLFYIDNYDGSGFDLYYKKTARLGGDPKKITEDVNLYDINDKGTKVTYVKNGGDLYQHNLKQQTDKIDSGVMSFIASDNGKKILYQKLSQETDRYCVDIYISKSGKAGKLIASAVDKVCDVSDDMSLIYFIKSGALYKMKVGSEPKMISDKASNVVKVYDSGKVYFTVSIDKGAALYYYNGKKDVELVSNSFYSCEDASDEKPVMLYYSETITDDSVEYKYNIAWEDKTYALDYNISSAHLSEDGEELYFISNSSLESGAGDLMRTTVSKKKIKEPKKIESNVFAGYYVSSDKFMFVKNYVSEKYQGDVYINNKKVGENIFWGFINYCEISDTLVYFTDITGENRATLNIHKGKRSKKISENVVMYSLTFTPEGEFLFINNFDSGMGTLNICKNKSAKKVDTEVSSIIKIPSNEEYDESVISKF
jgi:hypothetical protein